MDPGKRNVHACPSAISVYIFPLWHAIQLSIADDVTTHLGTTNVQVLALALGSLIPNPSASMSSAQKFINNVVPATCCKASVPL